MMRCAIVAVVAVVFTTAALPGGETKAKRPVGTWARAAGDIEVKFEFKEDTLKCTLVGMGLTIDIDADYAMSKDNVVFGRVSKVSKKGACVGPSVGDLFTFKIAVKNKTLTISELGPQNNADARELIEGEYKAKK
jgi:hypothetical protein